MPYINIFGHSCQLDKDENLLDGLLRQGIRIPYSCRAGVCHSCLLKLKSGLPPEGSQRSLTPLQIKKGYILACQSTVSENLDIEYIQRDEMPATIIAKEMLTPTRILLTLTTRFPVATDTLSSSLLLSLCFADNLTGHFPVESVSGESNEIKIALERKAGDPLSAWIYEHATPGVQLMIKIIENSND
ncbi:2Fe-2S iron-sulfur cluster-binding protein [Endozoicomonas sp. Mp262]|uniref:2Fe-2S iron-sulfur cluster-binding protein n=1 Tax=Endozoicomonas sp. Mp262 TaxID=2919499 RepID=UPI0021D8A9CC